MTRLFRRGRRDAPEREPNAPRSGRRRLVRRGGRVVLAGVVAYYAVWAGEYSLFDLRSLAVQRDALEGGLGVAEERVDSLEAVAEALRSDPATIERVARERFGMIRDGEILFRFVESRPAPRADDPGSLARRP